MARKKPVSGKARKEQLQHKRAIKRANPADPSSSSSFSSTSTASLLATSTSKPRLGQRYRTPEQRARDEQHAGRMKLESRFIRLPKHLAERTEYQAAMEKLERPIKTGLAVLTEEELLPMTKGKEKAVVLPGEEEEVNDVELSCPKRPRWRYTQTKAEVEKNEEGMFRKWLAEIDSVLSRPAYLDSDDADDDSPSPTFFERNLNVWRQLWRTVETSDILLVLIDVRFPLLHYPPSLRHYLRTLKPHPKPVILVLTKTDLVPRWVSEAWRRYFEEDAGAQGEGDGHAEGGAKIEVVLMESYKEEERGEDTQGTHARLLPAAPPPARHALLSALRRAHESLLTPPPIVAENPERLARWKPKVRKEVDWEGVEEEGGETGVRAGKKDGKEVEASEKGRKSRRKGKGKEELAPPRQDQAEERGADGAGDEGEGEEDYPFVTVGLIGQPNVGKSSLLNALLGRKVVRASRTPGKTKTLQTIYWNYSLRLCDCPGLVCPSAAGFERQVLGGVLPIQNVEAVLHFVGQRIPLEKVLKLKHAVEMWQGEDEEDEEDEDEFSLDSPEERAAKREATRPRWTTDELLAAYALQQGFVTAKVGRPDIYRAGAFILRLLHSSAIPWTFLPPSLDAYEQQVQRDEMEGIWLRDFVPKAGQGRSGAEHEAESGSDAEQASEDEDDDDEVESESDDQDSADEKAVQAVRGAFAALAIEEGEDDEESEPDGSERESD
ncbi:hypothetical protein NBRC10512_002371 [Rhodotorula toruloides]|uniref:Guanine nucleotide-binding protein-like 1 n=2 Tax=Rhodotorula toruloides TaxID=5286 RepID=A0A061B754_RHOTO|nr:mmr1/hsr1 GTP binding protein [Rhodotorula toruloides NP11]EMS22302.1 mmr1/hsr1 GTP binding protein [Rhodotorula toruloides NP11]CDR43698.1 RHTO0S08e04610g1_1 [Rhodotorula toruloides]